MRLPFVSRDIQYNIMKEAIATTNLTEEQKLTLSARFLTLLLEYKKRARKYSYSFNILRTMITVGSLIVPALLSVQYVANSGDSSHNSSEVYWVVWNLSLFVTISNGLMTMLKVDKKYFILNTTYQHLQSEGWQYVHLSGKYSGFYTPHSAATHHNQFIFFCNSIEKIRMRQVEEEYYKVDTSHTQPHGGGAQQHDQLIPPTPVNPAKTLTSLPFADDDKKSVPSVNEDAQTPREFGQRPREWDRAEVQSPSASYETDKGQGHSSTVRRKNPAPAEKHEPKEIQFTYTLTTTPSTPTAKAAALSTIDEGSPDEHA